MNDSRYLLRGLPSITRILESLQVQKLEGEIPVALLKEESQKAVDSARRRVLDGDLTKIPTLQEFASIVLCEAARRNSPSLCRAINATGIVLHTGLGRARLSKSAVEAVHETAANHSLLEIDRVSGKRGSRRDHVCELLCELTGAENVMVVNNCAAAVFLAVSALASGREVIISRGELVEIGGAFRMPDIIKASGATLVEVGTTNRTRISDYAEAVTDRSGLILRCSPSNFAIIGFTESTSTSELVALGKEKNIPVMDDQGSGSILLPSLFGLPESKGSLRESVISGSDVIAASGDKLLGGPQAGILLGSRIAISMMSRHPLARALRVDKLTLAALEATLRLYREPERALAEIPTLKYLTRSLPELTKLAQNLKRQISLALSKERFEATIVPENSEVGGGSLPGESLPTVCVALRSLQSSPTPDEIAAALRRNTPPIFARIKANQLLFDPRTLELEEMKEIAQCLTKSYEDRTLT